MIAPELLTHVERIILLHAHAEHGRRLDLAEQWATERSEANMAEPYDHARYQRANRLAALYLRTAIGGNLASVVEDLAIDSGETYSYVIDWLRETDRLSKKRQRP